MPGKSVRVGVIGVGFGSIVQIPAFQSEGLEVIAVCARRRERAQEAADRFGIPNVFTDYRELLAMNEVDAVSIVTPPALHHEMALAALAAGKHILCEKPFSTDQKLGLEMYERAKSSGLTAMVAHEFRFSSGRMRAKELIDEGYVGRLNMCVMRLVLGPSQRPEPLEFSPDRDSAVLGGGFLWALGSHYIDCLRFWFGEIESVSGEVGTFQPERLSGGQKVAADADDTFLFTLHFAGGGLAQMTASRSAPFGSGAAVEVYGSEGTLFVPQTGMNPPAHGQILGARLGEEKLQELPMPARLEPFSDERDQRLMPFRLLARDFVRGIAEGTSPAPSFYDGWRCQQVLDAVRESSETGRRVRIAT